MAALRYGGPVPHVGAYDIFAFYTGIYYYYYWQNHDILEWCKQNKHLRRITGNKYSTLHVIKK